MQSQMKEVYMHSKLLKSVLGASALTLLTSTSAFGAMAAQDFVTKASVSNQFEIESSKLAIRKSQNPEIRLFAQRMIDDHGKAAEELEDAVGDSDTKLEVADALDARHQALTEKLEAAADGTEFDRSYLSMQKTAHAEAVKLFSDYAATGDDEEIREFASETLPILKKHKQHIDSLKK
jgi:putative membrane protein